MNMENLSHLNEKINEESDLFRNPLSNHINDSILILGNTNYSDKQQNVVDIGIQTDSNWLEIIKKELLSSLQYESSIKDQDSKKHPSKPGTIRSQLTKPSGIKSGKQSKSVLGKDCEMASNYSSDRSETSQVYEEARTIDDFRLNPYSSSEDEMENEFDLEKLTELANESSVHRKKLTNDEDNENAIGNNMIVDAGLPTTLKVPKELGSRDIQPQLTADVFLTTTTNLSSGKYCEFCKKPLVGFPSAQEQVESNVNTPKLSCCQEYRDLVDFALAYKQEAAKTSLGKKDEVQLIDISPHKSHKSAEELAEDKAKSEKKIREKLQERQNAALIAAQTTKIKIDGPRRAYTEIGVAMVRPKSPIRYKLSNFDFLENGWTIKPPAIPIDELFAKEEIKNSIMNIDYNKFIDDIFGQIGLSNQCSEVGVIRQYYPDGQLFLIIFPTGSACIYYPSGNLAISIIRETIDSSMICVIQEDSSISGNRSRILGIVNSNGFGSFSYGTGEIKILYDTITGMEMLRDGSKKWQWCWDGKPHINVPPFQPLFFSINKYIGVRISSQNGVFINFFSITRQIHINAGFRSEISDILTFKMQTVVKMELSRLMKPLADIKSRVRVLIDKSQEALGYPNLLFDNKWPIKPFTLAKINTAKKTTLSLSLL